MNEERLTPSTMLLAIFSVLWIISHLSFLSNGSYFSDLILVVLLVFMLRSTIKSDFRKSVIGLVLCFLCGSGLIVTGKILSIYFFQDLILVISIIFLLMLFSFKEGTGLLKLISIIGMIVSLWLGVTFATRGNFIYYIFPSIVLYLFSIRIDEIIYPEKEVKIYKFSQPKMTGDWITIYSNIELCVILSIVTFGIFQIFWIVNIIRKIHAINKDERSITAELLLFLFIPFYSVYWFYKTGKDLENLNPSFTNPVVYLILTILGLGIVSMAILQNDLNHINID